MQTIKNGASKKNSFYDICFILLNKIKQSNSISPEKESSLVELYDETEALFKRADRMDLSKLIHVSNDLYRINQIETIFDLYAEKISKVKNNDNLDSDEKGKQIEYWNRLRDQEVSNLEG